MASKIMCNEKKLSECPPLVFPKQFGEWRARPMNNPKDKKYLKEMLEDVIQAQSSGQKLSSVTIPDNILNYLSLGCTPSRKERTSCTIER